MEASDAVLRDVLLEHGLSEGTIKRMLLARNAEDYLEVGASQVIRERPQPPPPLPLTEFETARTASVQIVRTYEYALPQVHSPMPLGGFVVMFRSKPLSQTGVDNATEGERIQDSV